MLGTYTTTAVTRHINTYVSTNYFVVLYYLVLFMSTLGGFVPNFGGYLS